MSPNFEISRLTIPIDSELADDCIRLWEATFAMPFVEFRSVAAGKEAAINRHILYVARKDGQLAATVGLTIDRSGLGGLGEVATVNEFRGNGLASAMCEMARDEFRNEGGEVLFLGTVNPAARRIYRRLGWQRLPGTEVMACLTNNISPEEYLVERFRRTANWSISTPTAAMRLPIIPLCYVPHDWQVLDANTRLYSTRCAVQKSCMSLYPRYQELIGGEQTTCFSMWTDDGKLVGLSSAKIDALGHSQVDGFSHYNFADTALELLQHAIDWSRENNAEGCSAVVSIEDDDKRDLFTSLGFAIEESADDFDFDGTKVGALKLVRQF